MSVILIIWFGAAISGAIAAVVAVAMPSARQSALIAAGTNFAVAGVLGIFSIGMLFIGLAVFCFSRLIALRNSSP
jgi:hypothetical protein